MPPQLRDESTHGTSYSCNSVVGFSMNGYEYSDTANDTDEWEESLEIGEYLSDEEWIPESHLIPVIWYNPFQPQGSWSDDDEDQEAVQNAVDPAQTNAPNECLAIEQEQDHINQLRQNLEPEVPENLQASPLVTPENEESCWIGDPLTSKDESEFQQTIIEASSIGVACNAIAQDDSTSEAPFAKARNSQTTSGSISSGATSSRVTSTEIASSQPSSLETMTSEFKPFLTDHHEEALADEENAPCNAITEDGNAAAEAFSVNGEDQPLEPEEGLPKEEPPLEAFEVGKGYIKEMPIHRVQIDPGSALNLISTTALEELGIPPSKLSHTSVSIVGYNGSTQRPIGKIRFKLQIGDLISEVTMYVIKTPSCYNILLGHPRIHENGVVASTLHQCIKFVGNDGLIHRVFADRKPFKGKEVHFADSQMYKDEEEEKEEETTSFAGNLQKDKGKAP
ncbi:hypothetical protein AAC387_Pa12g0617 [Persea americana]